MRDLIEQTQGGVTLVGWWPHSRLDKGDVVDVSVLLYGQTGQENVRRFQGEVSHIRVTSDRLGSYYRRTAVLYSVSKAPSDKPMGHTP